MASAGESVGDGGGVCWWRLACAVVNAAGGWLAYHGYTFQGAPWVACWLFFWAGSCMGGFVASLREVSHAEPE